MPRRWNPLPPKRKYSARARPRWCRNCASSITRRACRRPPAEKPAQALFSGDQPFSISVAVTHPTTPKPESKNIAGAMLTPPSRRPSPRRRKKPPPAAVLMLRVLGITPAPLTPGYTGFIAREHRRRSAGRRRADDGHLRKAMVPTAPCATSAYRAEAKEAPSEDAAVSPQTTDALVMPTKITGQFSPSDCASFWPELQRRWRTRNGAFAPEEARRYQHFVCAGE